MTALATVVIAVFTVVLAAATISQAEATRRSLDIARNLAQNEEARIKLLERARIVAKASSPLINASQHEVEITAEYALENFGRTPAIVTANRGELFVGLAEEAGTFKSSVELRGTQIVYPQQATETRSRSQKLTMEEYREISGQNPNGKRRLFLFGYAKYEDIFGVKRTKYFCLKAVPQPGQFVFKPTLPYDREEVEGEAVESVQG